MNKIAISAVCFLALAYPAFAQSAPPSEKEFTLKVTATEAVLLGEAMGLMQYGRIQPLMTKLQQQINEQNAPVPTAAVPAPTNKPDAPK